MSDTVTQILDKLCHDLDPNYNFITDRAIEQTKEQLDQFYYNKMLEILKPIKGHIPEEECCDVCDYRHAVLVAAKKELLSNTSGN